MEALQAFESSKRFIEALYYYPDPDILFLVEEDAAESRVGVILSPS